MPSGTLNLKTIKIPKSIDNPLISFTKKNNTTFTHFHIGIEMGVQNRFTEWLNSDLKTLSEHAEIMEFDPTTDNQISYIQLNDNPIWNTIKNSLFDLTKQSLARNHTDLANVNHCYAIYEIYDKEIFARINRLKPSYVMNGQGFFLASSFDSIIEEKGVRLEGDPHIIFHSDLAFENPVAIIINGPHFEHIFDYSEYKTQNAREVIKKDFSKIIDEDIATSVILEDKNLINMLNKPLVKSGNINTSISYLKTAKAESKTELTYEIKGNKIIFPEEPKKRKKAVHDMLKAATYHITATLDKKHIIEGNPLRIIK